MKWYTCILHIPKHVSSVQWFYTRAETPGEAERNAVRWFLTGEADRWTREDVDVPFVFEGRREPEELPEESLPI